MSEIPFVDALGENLLAATRRAIAHPRRRRRRVWILGGLIAAVGAGAATAGFYLTRDGERAATIGIACEVDGNVVGISARADDPVSACRTVLTQIGAELGDRVPANLVACQPPEMSIYVIEGLPGACERRGWPPLDADYTEMRSRIVKLQAALRPLERACFTVDAFLPRAQELVDRGDWTGWRVVVRAPDALPEPPLGDCATITNADGTIEGGLDIDTRRLYVWRKPRQELIDAHVRLTREMATVSAARCHDDASLARTAREVFAAAGVRVRSITTNIAGPSVDLGDPLQHRLERGCSIGGVDYAPDGRGLVLTIMRRDT